MEFVLWAPLLDYTIVCTSKYPGWAGWLATYRRNRKSGGRVKGCSGNTSKIRTNRLFSVSSGLFHRGLSFEDRHLNINEKKKKGTRTAESQHSPVHWCPQFCFTLRCGTCNTSAMRLSTILASVNHDEIQ